MEAPSLEEEHFMVGISIKRNKEAERYSPLDTWLLIIFQSPRSWPPTMSTEAALTGLGVNNSIK